MSMGKRNRGKIPTPSTEPEGSSADREADSSTPDADRPVWARNLQRLTRRSGLTQAELARRAGLQRDAYGRYLLGRTRPPAPKLLAIARALGVRPEEIDPDRSDLDEAALRVAAPLPYRITPSGGSGRRVRLEVSAEMDVAYALRIVELIAEANEAEAVGAPKPGKSA